MKGLLHLCRNDQSRFIYRDVMWIDIRADKVSVDGALDMDELRQRMFASSLFFLHVLADSPL